MEAKLVCNAGPRAGTEFHLSTTEVTIGRAAEVEVSIPDTSVSRRHTRLSSGVAGWSIADLGSGNGTIVNGERLEDEVPLRNGDVITLGDTELTFVDVANSTDRAPIPSRTSNSALARRSSGGRSAVRPRVTRAGVAMLSPVEEARQKRVRRLIALGAVGLLVLVAGGKVIQVRLKAGHDKVTFVQAQEEARLGELFQGGVQQVREGKWREAKEEFEKVKAVRPDYTGLSEYLDRAQKEIPNQEALETAQDAIKANRLGVAAAQVKKVSSDSTLFKQLSDTKALLEAKVPLRVSAARTALDEKKYKEALDIGDDLLKAYPDNRDAQVITEQAAAALNQPRTHVNMPMPSTTVAQPWEPAVQRFIDGDLSAAVALANGCSEKSSHCKELMRQMTEFGELSKKMEDLDARGLKKLLDLNASITNGRGSKLARNAQTRAAGIFYKAASAARAANQWGKAAENAKNALKADPSNGPARQLLEETRSKAKEIYLFAYQQEHEAPDDAISKYKEVLQMTAPDDEYHLKAQKRLSNLSNATNANQ